MDVRGVGAGPAGAELAGALHGLAGPKAQVLAALEGLAQSGDTITEILRLLSEPQAAKILEIIEGPPRPENAARVEGLLRESVSAAAQGDVPQALAKLAQLAALDPRRAGTLDAEPGLAAIRPEVRQLLSRLTSAARSDAQARLDQATRVVGQDSPPQIAVLLAGRFLEAGGYANCMRSAELSKMSINYYAFAPAPASKKSWPRSPRLVLLLAWLAVGLVIALGLYLEARR